VRHDDECRLAAQRLDRPGELRLRPACRGPTYFVEDEHRRVAAERARDPDALALAPGEAGAALADRRVEARGQGREQRVELRSPDARRSRASVHVRVATPSAMFPPDRRVEQERSTAWDVADPALPGREARADVRPVDVMRPDVGARARRSGRRACSLPDRSSDDADRLRRAGLGASRQLS
jgi:hypothetical protein